MNLNDLYRQKQQAWYSAEDLIKNAEAENRTLNDDELKTWNKALDDMNNIEANIQAVRKADELRSVNATIVPTFDNKPMTAEERHLDWVNTLNKWMRTGTKELTPDERTKLGLKQEEGRYSIELRTPGQQTITTTGGGYMIQTDLMPWIETAMKYYGPMLNACYVFQTDDGRPITWPSLDDTSNKGAAETINADMFDSSTALTFGQITFGAIKYSSEGILVPYELLQDSSFNVAQVVGETLGERLWKILNYDMTVGDGSGNCNGIVYSTGGSVLGENAANATLTRTDIIRLIHSVDPAYRMAPKCAFMMNDTTIRYIKLLTIGTNDDRGIWQPSMIDGQPNKIEGYPYWINNDMDSIGANKKPVIFGDLGKYYIRQAGPLRVVRLTERYAELDDVGFIVIGRYDAKLLRANTTTYCPVKHIRNLGT